MKAENILAAFAGWHLAGVMLRRHWAKQQATNDLASSAVEPQRERKGPMQVGEISLRNLKSTIHMVGMDPETRTSRHEVTVGKMDQEATRFTERDFADLTRLMESVANSKEVMGKLVGVKRELTTWGRERGIAIDPAVFRTGPVSVSFTVEQGGKVTQGLTFHLTHNQKPVMTMNHEDARDLADLGHQVCRLLAHTKQGGTIDTWLEKEGYKINVKQGGHENWLKPEEMLTPRESEKTQEHDKLLEPAKELLNGKHHTREIAR